MPLLLGRWPRWPARAFPSAPGPPALGLTTPQAELLLLVEPEPTAEPQSVLVPGGSAPSSLHGPEASPKASSRAAPLAPHPEPVVPREPLACVPKLGTAAKWLGFAAPAADAMLLFIAALLVGRREQGRFAAPLQALPASSGLLGVLLPVVALSRRAALASQVRGRCRGRCLILAPRFAPVRRPSPGTFALAQLVVPPSSLTFLPYCAFSQVLASTSPIGPLLWLMLGRGRVAPWAHSPPHL